jgi:hypothetical protein
MKKPSRDQPIRIIIVIFTIFGLSSCISTDGFSGSSGYGSGFYGSPYYGNSPIRYTPVAISTDSVFGPDCGNGSFFNQRGCSSCDYNPCRYSHKKSSNCNHSDRNNHSDNDKRKKNGKKSSNRNDSKRTNHRDDKKRQENNKASSNRNRSGRTNHCDEKKHQEKNNGDARKGHYGKKHDSRKKDKDYPSESVTFLSKCSSVVLCQDIS